VIDAGDIWGREGAFGAEKARGGILDGARDKNVALRHVSLLVEERGKGRRGRSYSAQGVRRRTKLWPLLVLSEQIASLSYRKER